MKLGRIDYIMWIVELKYIEDKVVGNSLGGLVIYVNSIKYTRVMSK